MLKYNLETRKQKRINKKMKNQKSKTYYNTLNESLEAARKGLSMLWPLDSNIQYNSTVNHIVEEELLFRYISVYRNSNGYYEIATTYRT